MKHKHTMGLFVLPMMINAQSGDAEADGVSEWANSLRGLQPMIAKMGTDMMGEYWGILSAITTILALGLIFYIFTRVYRSLLAGEPIDWWSLLKPAKILLLVMCYPLILNLITVVLSPIRGVTANSNVRSHERMVDARRAALENSEEWNLFLSNSGEGDFEKYQQKYGTEDLVFADTQDRITFGAQQTWMKIKYSFKALLSELLRLAYESAILILHFISTFYLVILVIFGPIPLALTLFPGFENGFTSWIAQYIDKFLWLPIANVLATLLNNMQLEMIKASVVAEAIGEGSFFSSTDFGYLMFMIIGIASFMSVPSISGLIVSAGSPSSSIGNASRTVATAAVAGTAAAAGGFVGASRQVAQKGKLLVDKIRGTK